MFGRATITLGIGPHSSVYFVSCFLVLLLVVPGHIKDNTCHFNDFLCERGTSILQAGCPSLLPANREKAKDLFVD